VIDGAGGWSPVVLAYGGQRGGGSKAAALTWGALTTAWVVKAPRTDLGRIELALRA
jgi:hypothetical protein